MEKTYTITEKQIRELLEYTSSTGEDRIKEFWPDAFKGSNKVGNWVKGEVGHQLYFIEKVTQDDTNMVVCYGFTSDGNWVESDNRYRRILDWPIADDSVVKEALIKEANKRYKQGCIIISMCDGEKYHIDSEPYARIEHNGFRCFGISIMRKGQWATIAAKEMTKEEIETALGFKVKIV